jgi:hypothetical protein
MTMYYKLNATCSECGYKCEARGRAVSHQVKLSHYTICPECSADMSINFCSHVDPEQLDEY